ncbi:MAG: PIN domain-containing protein [Synergistaceae bacterium]|nr:PIN domain-containing protein [Synergistaceae bacterium]
MKTVFVDTNVILDVLLQNDNFFQDSLKIFKLAELGTVRAYVSASSLTDIFYITRKHLTMTAARSAVNALLDIFHVAGVDGDDLKGALDLPILDMEDALQLWCAQKIRAEALITRDAKGFSHSSIAAFSPADFLESY